MSEAPANTSILELDRILDHMQKKREHWAKTDTETRIALLQQAKTGLAQIAEEWVRLSLQAKGGSSDQPSQGQEWLAGPYVVMRNLNLLIRSLEQIRRTGRTKPPGKPYQTRFGRLAVPVFPTNLIDRMLFWGTRAEIRLQDGIGHADYLAGLTSQQGETQSKSRICLVLGGGNVSSIGPMDCLYKMYNEGKLCVLKMHPVNSYLGPLLTQAFSAMLNFGCLAIVYGDAVEGSYLCRHKSVDEIHITGSDKTHDMIVFGPDSALQKQTKTPILNKPITSELGNVSPVIVVPGQWSEDELNYHAINLASSLINNAGFNCNASRVIITHKGWPLRDKLLAKLRDTLSKTPCRKAYYPGAKDRFSSFLNRHPNAELFGSPMEDQLPWMFVSGLNPDLDDEICFQTEAFCGIFSEVALEALNTETYLKTATDFANQKLWGTLNATLIIHPSTQNEPGVSEAFDRAIEQLRYGTVSVNLWAGVGYALCCTSWGAYPGHDIFDIRSGLDVVHNTFMIERIEKSVVFGPFRQRPIPPYFVTHRHAGNLARNLFEFETNQKSASLFKTLACALK